MTKKNIFLLVLVPVTILVVIAVSGIIYTIVKANSNIADAGVVTHSSSIYKMIGNETTAAQPIESDQSQDITDNEFILFQNPDEQTRQEINDNEMLLASITSFMYGGMGQGSFGIATCICQDTVDMNNFIDSSLGWPVSDEYPDSEYADARLYISQLIGSMDGSTEFPTNLYPDIPLGAQQFMVQYSVSTGTQYIKDSDAKYYRDTLSNYMKIGHPRITTINSMVLSVDDPKVFDRDPTSPGSDLQATIETDTGKYFVYLMYEEQDGVPGFKVLDIVKLS